MKSKGRSSQNGRLAALLTAGLMTAAGILPGSGLDPAAQPLAVHAEETAEIKASETGLFNSGTTVVPSQDSSYAVTAFGDGVYVIEDGDAVRVFEASMDNDAVLVTDGRTVYFTDSEGMLCRGRIGSAVYEELYDTGGLDPAGIAGGSLFLVSGDTLDGETGILDSFGYVVRADLTDGSQIEKFEGFDAECCDGYTVLYKKALDVSPRQLYIFDRNGEQAVSIPDATGYSFDRGILYVGSFRYGPEGTGSCVIRRFVPDGTGLSEEVAADETCLEGREAYGVVMGGYLAMFPGAENTYLDMRTGEVFAAEDMEAAGEVWITGLTSGGTDYVCSSGSLARLEGGHPRKVFNIPETGIINGATFYADGWFLTDGFDGQYYILPVTESEVTALDLYSSAELYEDTADGHTVYHCIPHISTDHPYTYEAANDRLEAQTALWEEISDENAGIGIAAAGPGSSEAVYSFINAYVARSDTSILSLEQLELVQRDSADDDYRMVRGINISTQTGEDLVIGDLVTDLDALRDAVCRQVQVFYGIDPGDFAEYAAGMFPDGEQDRGTEEYSFSVGYEALSIYFASGILEEDAGYSRLLIPYAAYPSLFTELVTKVPAAYSYDVRLSAADPYAMQDSFRIFCTMQSDPAGTWAYDRLLILSEEDLTGHKNLDEIPDLPLECGWAYGRIMHTSDGRDYLYLLTDGPQAGTSVYAVAAEPSFAGRVPLEISGTMISEYTEWFADPERFGLFEETAKGMKVRCYRTGEDGMPECLEVTGTDAVLFGTEGTDENEVPAAGEKGTIQYAEAVRRFGSEEEGTFEEYREILLDGQTRAQYPALAEMVSELNAYQEQYYRDAYGKGTESGSSRYYFRRSDEAAFSILEYCAFSGGERDGYAWYSYNIDPETGNFLHLSDIIADTDRFRDMMRESVHDMLDNEETAAYFEGLMEQLDGRAGEGLAWTVDPAGITIFLALPDSRLEFGAPVEISLLYDEHPEMFTDRFRRAEDGFSMELIPGDYVYTDIGSDGSMDEVCIAWDETGDMNGSFMISVNGAETEDHIGITGTRCWYVRTADGHDLAAAVSGMGEGFEEYVDLYTLGESVEWAGGLPGRFTGEPAAEESGEILYSLCDPDDFGIRFGSDLIGTMYLSCRAYLEGAGGLYPSEERMQAETFDGGNWTVRQPFRARVLNTETMIPGISAVIPEGTVLRPLYTDGVSYVDCMAVDGGSAEGNAAADKIYRLELEFDAAGNLVLFGDFFAEELLDGVEYAQ